MRRLRITKLISGLLLISLCSIAVFSNVAFAESKIKHDEAAVTNALNLINNANQLKVELASSNDTTRPILIEKVKKANEEAKEALNKLSTIDLIHVYVDRMGSHYYANYEKDDFKYFGTKLYLANNEDVNLKAGSTQNPGAYAVRHYLTFGIFEGRASCSRFDAAVAIAISKEAAIETLILPNPALDDLRAAFKEKTGKDTTAGFKVVLSGGDFIVVSTTSISQSSSNRSREASKEERTPSYITTRARNLANSFTPYMLYQNKRSSQVQTFTLSNGVSATFYGDNYQKVKSTDKPYTMMIYMTGSDQEVKNTYCRVSAQIVSMLKSTNLDNVNVLLCLGGSPDYQNTYLSNDIKNIGTGIYLLNIDGLTENQRNAINNISSEQLIADTTSGRTSSNILSYNSLINENTLIKLATTGSIDMGDGQLLAGFINFSSQLFPSNDYGLILSNHGGGELYGVCSAESNATIKGTSLNAYELEAALASTDIYKINGPGGTSDGKLGLLFYDACLMGSTEQAYVLKDYYRYMLASEEVTANATDYFTLLTSVNNNATNDLNLANEVYKAYNATSWHKGMIGTEATSAVYSSAGIESTTKALGNFGDTITAFSKEASKEDLTKVFDAIRKSLLSCNDFSCNSSYRYSDYRRYEDCVDIGEFMTYLKANLSNVSVSPESMGKVNSIVDAIDKVLGSGFIVASSLSIDKGITCLDAKNSNGKVITIEQMSAYLSNEWKALHPNSGYYGASLVLPLTPISGDQEYLEIAGYKGDFKESDIKGYISMLGEYFKYYEENFVGDTSRKAKLASDMTDVGKNIDLVITPGTLTEEGDIAYINFTVKATYPQGLTESAYTFGSPMHDILETTDSIRVAITSYSGSSETREVYSVSNLDTSSLDLSTNSINIDISLLTTVVTYWLNGASMVTDTLKDGNFTITSYLEYSPSEKKTVVSALTQDENIDAYNTFEGEWADSNKVRQQGTVIHVFDTIGNYIGSSTTDGLNTWTTDTGVGYIACYEYTIDDSGQYENQLCHLSISDTDKDSYFFDVTGANAAEMRSTEVLRIALDETDPSIEPDNLGVSLSINGTDYTNKAEMNIKDIYGDNQQGSNSETVSEKNSITIVPIEETETTEAAIELKAEESTKTIETVEMVEAVEAVETLNTLPEAA